MYLTVVSRDGKFTGVQYKEDKPNIREHHAKYGHTLVWLDYQLENKGTEDYEDYGYYEEGMESRPLGKLPQDEMQELKELVADLTEEVLLGE